MPCRNRGLPSSLLLVLLHRVFFVVGCVPSSYGWRHLVHFLRSNGPPRRIRSRLRHDMSPGFGLIFVGFGFSLFCFPVSFNATRPPPSGRPQNAAVEGGRRSRPTCRFYGHLCTSASGLAKCSWQSLACVFSLLIIGLRMCLPAVLVVFTSVPLSSWASLPLPSLCLCVCCVGVLYFLAANPTFLSDWSSKMRRMCACLSTVSVLAAGGRFCTCFLHVRVQTFGRLCNRCWVPPLLGHCGSGHAAV